MKNRGGRINYFFSIIKLGGAVFSVHLHLVMCTTNSPLCVKKYTGDL